MKSLIETLAVRSREMLESSKAARSDDVSEALIEESTHVVDAIAFLPPQSDRDAITQGALLLDYLSNGQALDELKPCIEHRLALGLVRYFAARSGIELGEIVALFERQQPTSDGVGSLTSSATAPDRALPP